MSRCGRRANDVRRSRWRVHVQSILPYSMCWPSSALSDVGGSGGDFRVINLLLLMVHASSNNSRFTDTRRCRCWEIEAAVKNNELITFQN